MTGQHNRLNRSIADAPFQGASRLKAIGDHFFHRLDVVDQDVGVDTNVNHVFPLIVDARAPERQRAEAETIEDLCGLALAQLVSDSGHGC